ncbi:MauE/DoxX family redox-associated membrane protein [Formosa sp. 3Alg 14/1]|uniref:MauE/DoxX family redox-associated membrane protein n=1 Tax=Formosa sp. 3Alg 14/1 TaxID=3382190 RepID=UPI0039BEC6A6
MKWVQKHTKQITEVISLLLILLLVYAAISKLIDIHNFQIELAQSPMLSSHSGWLSWLVPVTELIIATLLSFSKTRIIGLLSGFTLMIMFSTYIYFILNYVAFIPCSCGGVLENMDWTEHFIFNLFFVSISLLAFILHFKLKKSYSKIALYVLPISLSAFGILMVSGLHYSSERIIYHENPFIRRYSHNVIKSNTINLSGNTYYLAGFDQGKFYLGNTINPLRVTVFDTSFQYKTTKEIIVPNKDLPTYSSEIRIKAPFFYLIDGKISRVFKGKLSNWKTLMHYDGKIQFSNYEIIANDELVFKAYNSKVGSYNLGKMKIKDSLPFKFYPNLLRKQVDGIFDVDGNLQLDTNSDQLVYVYFYRNNYLVLDSALELKQKFSTIDTIRTAQLQIDTIHNGFRIQRKLISALMVNPTAFVDNNLLYVKSPIKGRFEPDKTWKQTETIDVYNINNGHYKTSFYIYYESGDVLKSFFILKNSFFGFIGNNLVQYDLKYMLK